MNINYIMLPFCITVFLIVAISGEEGRKEGRKKERMGERKIYNIE